MPPRIRRALSFLILASALCSLSAVAQEFGLPDGFVHLEQLIPELRAEARYVGDDNFIGRPIDGYQHATCILSTPAAQALAAAQRELAPLGLSLKVFDCYRPQRAVDHFIAWGKDPTDQKNKAQYYPNVPKEALFERGYIAEKSGHSRGSTVDLTLVATNATPGAAAPLPLRGRLLANGEVDMGSPFDLFDVRSHTDNPDFAPEVVHNRLWFKALLERHGFRNLPEEWWHYTLRAEPYPDRYFDFPVR
jgi:D-alanyl-D-alanine dipeptidase